MKNLFINVVLFVSSQIVALIASVLAVAAIGVIYVLWIAVGVLFMMRQGYLWYKRNRRIRGVPPPSHYLEP